MPTVYNEAPNGTGGMFHATNSYAVGRKDRRARLQLTKGWKYAIVHSVDFGGCRDEILQLQLLLHPTSYHQ